jgi:16S rRNA (guanine527-N7)-methyltransferase
VISDFKKIVSKEFKRNNLIYIDKIGEVFELYANLLVSENKKYNLTSITSTQDIVDKHFIDSILGFEKLKKKNSKIASLVIMDIGTGAGFPGVPLMLYDQICNNGKAVKEIHLLDSNKKKTEFLSLLADISFKFLGKNLITIHNHRLEKFELVGKSPDFFLSRATGDINKVVDYLAEFLANNGNIHKTSFLLYYGGLNIQGLEDRSVSFGSKIRFTIKNNIIAQYQYSQKNYTRASILFSLSPTMS